MLNKVIPLLTICLITLPQSSYAASANQIQTQVFVPPVPPTVHEIAWEEKVGALYGRAEQNLRAAGHEITLEVRNPETISPEEFDLYKTYQIFSLGEGVCLYIEPHTQATDVQLPDGSGREIDRFITFHLKWEADYWLMNADPERSKIFHAVRTRSFAEYMKGASKDDERLKSVEAVTSFEVHVSYDGRERVYQGMMVWLPEAANAERFLLVDRILLQLEKVLDPKLPIRPVAALTEVVELPQDVRSQFQTAIPGTLGNNTTTTCTPALNTHTAFSAKDGQEEHSGEGEHQSSAGIKFSCHCDTKCTSTCTPSFGSEGTHCADFAPIAAGRKHVKATAQDTLVGSKPMSLTEGAICAGGFGCVFQSCAIGNLFCSASVSINIDNTYRVTFPNKVATYSQTHGFQLQGGCDKCVPETESCLGIGNDLACGSDPTTIPEDGGATPVVIDVARNGFRFSGPEAAVAFDIDADGVVEHITWTAPGSDDAFLVLDRNENQVVDDGSELFGSVTEQPESDQRNGYHALAVFDAASRGGNEDGVVTAHDAVFSSLRLWKDENQDGISQPSELHSLPQAGIEGIELSYVTSMRRDRHGNTLRWASFVQFADQARLAATDVIFVIVPQEGGSRIGDRSGLHQ